MTRPTYICGKCGARLEGQRFCPVCKAPQSSAIPFFDSGGQGGEVDPIQGSGSAEPPPVPPEQLTVAARRRKKRVRREITIDALLVIGALFFGLNPIVWPFVVFVMVGIHALFEYQRRHGYADEVIASETFRAITSAERHGIAVDRSGDVSEWNEKPEGPKRIGPKHER